MRNGRHPMPDQRATAMTEADGAELTERSASMPPHPDVPAVLRRLRDHGFRLVTLTDDTLDISEAQLEKARVIDLFELLQLQRPRESHSHVLPPLPLFRPHARSGPCHRR